MQSAFEFFFAAWPLVVVAILAFVMIRAARGPKRHDVRGDGDYSRDAARSQGRRGMDLDGGGGDAD
ncbi:MAG: hypothetical protein AAGG09_16470 [Pseudomonadota bacterium]